MARKQVVTLTDDLDGKEISQGGATVSFGFQGVEYEIDLSDKNAEKLTKALQPYIDAGRRVGGRRTSARSSPAISADASQLAAMREWARSNGFEVADRGRVSKKVQEAYHASAS